MIGTAITLSWVRWRVLVNSLRSSKRRDAGEQISRVMELVVGGLLLLALLPIALGLAVGAFLGGTQVVGDERVHLAVTMVARILFAAITASVLIAPFFRSMQGSGLSIERLLLSPIPRRMLVISEIFGALTDPWTLAVLPALVLLPVGLVIAGAVPASAAVALGGLILALALASLGAAFSYGLVIFFRDRRRAELAALVVICLLVFSGLFLGVIGNLVGEKTRVVIVDEEGNEIEQVQQQAAANPLAESWYEPGFTAWLFPSESYALLVAGASGGEPGVASLALLQLSAQASLLTMAAFFLGRRVLGDPSGGSSRSRKGKSKELSLRVPFIGEAASAIAAMQLRTGLRTVRGRLALLLVPAMPGMMYAVTALPRREELPEPLLEFGGPLMVAFGGAMGLIGLSPLMFNLYAVHGEGLERMISGPLNDREIVRGTLSGCAFHLGIGIVAMMIVAVALSPHGHFAYWLASLLLVAASFCWIAPAASILSALFPKKADLSKIGKAGNAHQFAEFLSLLMAGIVSLAGIGFASIGATLFESPWITLLVMTIWLAVSAAGGWAIHLVGAATLESRRESVLLAAQR